MRRIARYGLSLAVAVAITSFVLVTTDRPNVHVLLSIALLYGAATSLVVSHWDVWYRSSRGPTDWASRKAGAIGAGVGTFSALALVYVSIPVCVIGIGLQVLGMAVAYADAAE